MKIKVHFSSISGDELGDINYPSGDLEEVVNTDDVWKAMSAVQGTWRERYPNDRYGIHIHYFSPVRNNTYSDRHSTQPY